MKTAKRAVFVNELAKLRESEPEVPMVSSLDIGLHGQDGTYLDSTK